MTDGAVITFAPPIFKGDDFFTFALFDDFGGDLSAAANLDFFAINMSKQFKRSGLAGLHVQKIDIDRVALRDTILPSTRLDDCVGHSLWSGEKEPRKVSQECLFGKQKGCNCRHLGGSYKALINSTISPFGECAS
jgi:hypothetical protein